MTRDEMEATLLLHGWNPGVTKIGNYVWVKEEKELFDTAIGIDKVGNVFTAVGPFFFLGELPSVSDSALHNLFGKAMAYERVRV
jgi:hypothetical protein